MRVIGKPVGVEGWRRHYEAMASGELSRKRIKNRRGRGRSYLYQVKSNQSGSGKVAPIKIISPTEANIEQAKKLIVNKRKIIKKSNSLKRKRPYKKSSGKSSKKKNKRKKRKVNDIFS